MKLIAEKIAEKYSVEYKELVGRGKTHALQAARRELVYRLMEKGFEEEEVAKFLHNRAIAQILRLKDGFKNRDQNKRKPRVIKSLVERR